MRPGQKQGIDLDAIMTLEEAALWLKLSPRELSQKARARQIPAMIVNRKVIRFHPRTVVEFFREAKPCS